MAIGLNPYLQFDGTAREAGEFYHSVFGGELSVMSYAEGMGDENPETKDLVMHSSLYVARGYHVMIADKSPEMPAPQNGTVSLSTNGEDPSEDQVLKDAWVKLAEGAEIQMPLEKAPWGDYFGQLVDKFGVTWMFNVGAEQASDEGEG
ncbi:VOC family protein [Zafaria sp. Z1313]|uniref:VOC family protein n=1 Tax=unclassified Zafaria TaxID=2828765 RepID=UPI002E7A7689|nr:VOC family protein [Zafaria sp. J156]MEE1621620.1 VOC family protein [Zafaria sp. J156]